MADMNEKIEAAALVLVQRDVGAQIKSLDELQTHDRREVTETARKMLAVALPPLRAREEIARTLRENLKVVLDITTYHGERNEIHGAKITDNSIEKTADAILSLPAGQEWRDAIQLCIDLMPSTAENPNEDAYQRGRFDGVTQYQTLIRANLPTPPVAEPKATPNDLMASWPR